MTQVRTRIAPSPTGFPHIGTIFQVLIDRVIADQNKGKFILRIEDTDRSRYVEGAEQKILDSLKFFLLDADESPANPGKFGPYRQSERLQTYQKYTTKLIDQGDAYYCFCSKDRLDQVRKDMQKQGKPPMYDQHCRHLDPQQSKLRAKSKAHVVRMKIPPNQTITFTDAIRGDISFESNNVDDQVIVKSDGFPTYHLAVVVDDHLMQITHMVRGEEWISSTPKHVLLYQYLDWQPPIFIHTPLLRNPDKSKLSKRHGHASVDWYIDQGYLPQAVINFLITRVWNHPSGEEIFPYSQIVDNFNISDMHIQAPVADLDKLDWINGQWIRNLSNQDLLQALQPFKPQGLSDQLLIQVLPFVKDRLVKLSDIDDLTQYFYQTPEVDTKLILKQSKMPPQQTADYLDQVITKLDSVSVWQEDELETASRQLQQDLQLKPRPAFMTIRVALSGRTATPPLFDVMVILGKTETLDRLKQVSLKLQVK